MFVPVATFTHESAASQLTAGIAAIDAGQNVFAFDQITNFDSSAVACMLAWKRHAQHRKADIQFQRLPGNLTRMIQLYGIAEFL